MQNLKFGFLLLPFFSLLLLLCSCRGGTSDSSKTNVYLIKQNDTYITTKSPTAESYKLSVKIINKTPTGNAVLFSPKGKRIIDGRLVSIEPLVWEGLIKIYESDGKTVYIEKYIEDNHEVGYGFNLQNTIAELSSFSLDEKINLVNLIFETQRALKQKNYLSALKYTEKFLGQFPNHILMKEYKGDAFYGLKDFDEALKEYQSVLNSNHPKKFRLYKKLGDCFFIKNEFNQSRNFALKAISNSKRLKFDEAALTLAEAYTLNGDIYLIEEKEEKAIAQFSSSIKVKGNIEAYNRRAIVYMHQNKDKQAENDLSRSIKMDSRENDKAYLARATLYSRNRKYEDARRDFEKLSQKESLNWDNFNWKGVQNGAILIAFLEIAFYNSARIVSFELVFWGCLVQTFLSNVIDDPAIAAIIQSLAGWAIMGAVPAIVNFFKDTILNTLVIFLREEGYDLLANAIELFDTLQCMGGTPSY